MLITVEGMVSGIGSSDAVRFRSMVGHRVAAFGGEELFEELLLEFGSFTVGRIWRSAIDSGEGLWGEGASFFVTNCGRLIN